MGFASSETIHLPSKLANPRFSPRKFLTTFTPYTIMGLLRMCARAKMCVCSRDFPFWSARANTAAQSCRSCSSSRLNPCAWDWRCSASFQRSQNLDRMREERGGSNVGREEEGKKGERTLPLFSPPQLPHSTHESTHTTGMWTKHRATSKGHNNS